VGFRLGAGVVVVVHLAYVVFVLVGGFLAWRWRSLARYHVPAVMVSAALPLAGLDCPLTDLEKWLHTQAGDAPYTGGFIEHYLVEPILSGGLTPDLHLVLRVATITVVAVAYVGVLSLRRQAASR
jgi:hypothetical protein